MFKGRRSEHPPALTSTHDQGEILRRFSYASVALIGVDNALVQSASLEGVRQPLDGGSQGSLIETPPSVYTFGGRETGAVRTPTPHPGRSGKVFSCVQRFWSGKPDVSECRKNSVF